jgi:hypothetical protein
VILITRRSIVVLFLLDKVAKKLTRSRTICTEVSLNMSTY